MNLLIIQSRFELCVYLPPVNDQITMARSAFRFVVGMLALQLSSALLVTMRPRGVVQHVRLHDSHAVRMMAEPAEEDPAATVQGEEHLTSAPCAVSTLHALHALQALHTLHKLHALHAELCSHTRSIQPPSAFPRSARTLIASRLAT